jgi:pantoate--beta-alanine ligase
MIICTTVSSLQMELNKLKKLNQSIGFVPTMGALHKGHLSLIEQCKNQNDVTVCSIFVNPTQFNDSADFAKYPKTVEQDLFLLEDVDCTIVFLPSVEEIYPKNNTSIKQYNLGFLETTLEGSARPGHFQGVCQVVERLLTIVSPQVVYLGQKDYQQCMVITQLVELMGWKNKLKIEIEATFREPTGLAMSSRNMRLTDAQLIDATAIYQSLQFIKNNISTTPIESIIAHTEQYLLQHNFEKIDYIAICNAESLAPITNFDTQTQTVALIAAFIGGVRLIDNLILN